VKEKAVVKGHILYGPIYVKCPEQANPKRQKIDLWLPGMEGRAHGQQGLEVIKMF
jgi:hypothetical protein